MNKIEIVNDEIVEKNIDDTITLHTVTKNDFFNVNTFEFTILQNTKLEINYKSFIKSKLEIIIHVCPNISFHLLENKTGECMKVRYKYYLNKNSTTDVFQFTDSDDMKEMTNIYLKDEGAIINYHLKALVKTSNDFDYVVYHESSKTSSNLYLNSVNFKEGETHITTSGFVPNKVEDCVLNHMSRVIELNDKSSTIKPNLFIDEYNVVANHSAHIGQFSKEDLFYLQSRGISNKDALHLLIKGFLNIPYEEFSYFEKRIDEKINQYWR